MTYHLQRAGTKDETIGAPIHAVNRAGAKSSEEKKDRFSSVVVSAVKICWRNWRPICPIV